MKADIYLASDHRGYPMKLKLMSVLQEMGYHAIDCGPGTEDRCDAGDYAQKVADALTKDRNAMGVLICGTGQAMAMTANRYRHVRAALCSEPVTARLTREHNDANILVLGADMIGVAMAQDCLKVFLQTSFLGGRYAERRDKLTAMGGL